MNKKLKKIGRPTDAPKTDIVKFRCDSELKLHLEICAKKLSITKSEVMRLSIRKLYEEICEVSIEREVNK